MKTLLREISDKFMVFHASAWGQVEQINIEAAAKSRTASMELGRLLGEWRKKSIEHQPDKEES
jgi:hypothetical protein